MRQPDPTFPYHTIVITGGTGTFGQACVQRLMAMPPYPKIRILSRDEFKQANMRTRFPEATMSFLLGDVRDQERLRLAFRGADLVIHAAALKHVPSGEYNPFEMVQTNIMGSVNVYLACIECEVPQAILLSSDKSVAPINLYGTTKQAAERLFVQANNYSPSTRFSVVRYGNVAGSRGSVIETFRQALKAGKPLPLTDPRMTRFWMTVDEAVDLVLGVAQEQLRGAIVVPVLPAFAMLDLCRAVLGDVALAANREPPPYRVTGIRPGEKLHEQLLLDDERARAWWTPALPWQRTPQAQFLVPPLIADWGPLVWPPSWERLREVAPYTSDVWPQRLTWEALQAQIQEVPDAAH